MILHAAFGASSGISKATVYADIMIDRVKRISERLDATMPGPEGVAKTIYKAAIDRSPRLRYAPYGRAYLLMHAILPDTLWRNLINNWMLGETGRQTQRISYKGFGN